MPLNIANEIEQEETTIQDLTKKLDLFSLVINALMNRNGYDSTTVSALELDAILAETEKYTLHITSDSEGMIISRPAMCDSFVANAPSSQEIN